jgi:hypothetical protein
VNRLLDAAAGALLAGDLDLETDALALGLYYSRDVDPAQTHLADLTTSIAGTGYQPLTGRSIEARWLLADDINFPTLPEGSAMRAIIGHRTSDGLLVFVLDTRPDRMLYEVEGNGGPLTVRWLDRRVVTI